MRHRRVLITLGLVVVAAGVVAMCRRADPADRSVGEGVEGARELDFVQPPGPRVRADRDGAQVEGHSDISLAEQSADGVVGRVAILGRPDEAVNGWVLLTDRAPPFEPALVRVESGEFRGPSAPSGRWRACVLADGLDMRERGAWPRDLPGAGAAEIAIGSTESWSLHVEGAGDVTVAIDEGVLAPLRPDALVLGPSDDALGAQAVLAVESDGALRVAGAPTLGDGVVWLRRGRSAWRPVLSPAAESVIGFEPGGDLRLELVRGRADLRDLALWMTRDGKELRRLRRVFDDTGTVVCEGLPVGRWSVIAGNPSSRASLVSALAQIEVLARAEVDIVAGVQAVARLELDRQLDPSRPPVEVEVRAGPEWPPVERMSVVLMPVGTRWGGDVKLTDIRVVRDTETGESCSRAELPPTLDGAYELLVQPFGYLEPVRIGAETSALRIDVPAPRRVRLDLPLPSVETTLEDLYVTAEHATSQAQFANAYPPRGIGADPYVLEIRTSAKPAFDPLRTDSGATFVDVLTAGQPLEFRVEGWTEEGSRLNWRDPLHAATPSQRTHRSRVGLVAWVYVHAAVLIDGRRLPDGLPLVAEFRHPEFGTESVYLGATCSLAAGDWQVVVRPPLGWSVRAPDRVHAVPGADTTVTVELVRSE